MARILRRLCQFYRCFCFMPLVLFMLAFIGIITIICFCWQKKINGRIMWANLHLLFWLSLFPFGTAWVGENYTQSFPVAVYGFVFFMAGVAFTILNHELVKLNPVHEALGSTDIAKLKSQISIGLYFISIFTAFIEPNISLAIFVIVAILWAIPLRAIEKLNTPS